MSATATLIKPETNAEAFAQTRPLTERMVDALRRADMTQLAQLSPAAGCMVPLLTALGLTNRIKDVLEALPMAQGQFDLLDLRNTLVNLGILSEAIRLDPRTLNAAQLPCLLECRDGTLVVVTQLSPAGFTLYYADEDRYHVGQLPTKVRCAYLLTDTRSGVGHDYDAEANSGWLSDVLMRFRGLLLQLVVLSFFVNVIALIPPLYIMGVYEEVIASRFPQALPYLVAGISVVMIVEGLLRWLRGRIAARVTARADYLASTDSLAQLLRLPPAVVERTDRSTQLGLAKQFDTLRDFFTSSHASQLLEVPFLPFYVIVVAWIAGPLYWVAAGMIALFACTGWLTALRTRIKTQRQQSQRSHRNQLLFDMLSGLEDIQCYRQQDTWVDRIRAASVRYVQDRREQASSKSWLLALSNSYTSIAGILVLGIGAQQVMTGAMGVGALIATMVIIWRLGGLLQGLLQLCPRWESLRQCVAQINRLMALPPERRMASAGLLVNREAGEVEFDGATFRYDGDAVPAIAGCSFVANSGDLIALTGRSGAGKTTLLKMVAGLSRPQSGAIHLNGLDIRQFDPLEYRQLLAYLPQDATLLPGTVDHNIRINQPDASHSEMVAAAREANVLHLIEQLPQGFATPIDPQRMHHLPSSLSHGIALARTFVRQCPILLLDEPGSNFDDKADRFFTQRLAMRKGRQTIVIASQRPSHIALASRVLVLDRGRLMVT